MKENFLELLSLVQKYQRKSWSAETLSITVDTHNIDGMMFCQIYAHYNSNGFEHMESYLLGSIYSDEENEKTAYDFTCFVDQSLS